MTDSSEDIERGELVYKACYCCMMLLNKLGTYDINIADCSTKTLRIHLGIGAGLITDVFVGGLPGRWEHFIAGDGVNQLSQVLDLAKAGIQFLIRGARTLASSFKMAGLGCRHKNVESWRL